MCHPTLSIVIPLFNEEENLQPLIEAIFSVLGVDPDFLELVLVDDGSCDRTATLAAELMQAEPRIRSLQHARNRGLGAAIRTGLAAVRGDLVLYTDADLPFDFTLVPHLLHQADENSLVIGYRLNRGEGVHRLLLTKGYNLLCWALMGFRVCDVNFACKLFPCSTLTKLELTAEGSFIDAEILLEGQRLGLKIVELPLTYFPRTRGESILAHPMVIVGILREMLRYLRQRRGAAKPSALRTLLRIKTRASKPHTKEPQQVTE